MIEGEKTQKKTFIHSLVVDWIKFAKSVVLLLPRGEKLILTLPPNF